MDGINNTSIKIIKQSLISIYKSYSVRIINKIECSCNLN